MKVSKDIQPLNNRLLETNVYIPIDVNVYIKGLDNMGMRMFKQKFKAGLANAIQHWTLKKGNNFGLATHFIQKILPKKHLEARAKEERRFAVILGDLTLNQERRY